eukprot:8465614-Ditylum_brightwellii.AAC.1
MSSKEDSDVSINKGGHQSVFTGGITEDDLYTFDNVCSAEQVDLLACRRNTPHLDVVENEVQFKHMKDYVENLPQSKDNDLEEVYFKEADSKEANMKETTVYKYGDDSSPNGIFDESKSVYESQSSAGRDKNCTALKKLSLSVHSSGSNHDVDKYGSAIDQMD